MAPVHWRDVQRMGLEQFEVAKEPPPAAAGPLAAAAPARTAAAAPRGIRAAPLPGSAAAAGAAMFRSGDDLPCGPPALTRIFQQSFNRTSEGREERVARQGWELLLTAALADLTYDVISKGGAARDNAIIE